MAAARRKGGRTVAGLPRSERPIVPKSSIAGRALVAVVAIMAFLASLTVGAVMLVRAAANEWQADVTREVTIQVRPGPGRDLEAEVRKAADTARTFPGIAEVRAFSKQESERLLEPWLGTGLRLDELPVPRLIVLKIAAGASPDLAQLRRTIEQRVAGGSLDDHRGWVDRMRTVARTAVAGGLIVLGLVFATTVLSVTFATRGAMATNRPIIEVLHFIGAEDSFIARRFQRHFLVLGFKGGAIGGGSAMLLFLLAQLVSRWSATTAGGDQVAMLFGSFSLDLTGYLAVLVQVVLIAAVTAATARRTVNKTLESIE
jgi:cell division transport system permease protein